MENNFPILPQQSLNGAITEILNCNQRSCKYGLTLTPEDAKQLVETRNDALRDNGRIELGGGIINKLILEFYDSPYFNRENYTQVLNELVDIFYYFKNGLPDDYPDGELISRMKKYFDGSCGGSIELLRGKEFEIAGEDEEEEEETEYWS